MFTFLSERMCAPATTAQLRTACKKVWDALVAEVGHVFDRFEASRNTRQIYNKFMNQHVRNWDIVVSFNYDTVFEDSIRGQYTFYYEGVQKRGKWQHRIIKPHGSINWTKQNEHIRVQKMPESCVVVAPTHLKFISNDSISGGIDVDVQGYLNQSKEIAKIWSSMELQMKEANALVFIGYSFPAADLYFSSVLRSVLAVRSSPPKFVVVNPDAVAIRQRLEARFSLRNIATYFDLGQFILLSRANVLKS